MPSYKGWRDGPPPLWYATHSTAYYIGVTGGTLPMYPARQPANWWFLQPRVNKFNNTFVQKPPLPHERRGMFRALLLAEPGHEGVKGRFRGELGSFDGDAGDGKNWGTFDGLADGSGKKKVLPNLDRPPLPPRVDPGGHGGAEGQLMNEFVTAILENRTPMVNIAEALNMTVAGVVASDFAKKDGELLKIPKFTMPTLRPSRVPFVMLRFTA